MNGLRVLLDTIIAPKEAFESLRERPTWAWALVITIALGVIGSILTTPAMTHAMLSNPAAMFGDKAGQMTPDDMAKAAAIGAKFASFGFIFVIFVVPIALLVSALIMLLFDKMGRGEGTFAKYFAAQANINVPIALGQIVLAIIVMVRGSDSFHSIHEVISSIPSIGWIVPTTNVKLSGFLSYMTPFTLWATALTTYSMIVIGKVPKLQAYLAGGVMLLGAALLTAAGAK